MVSIREAVEEIYKKDKKIVISDLESLLPHTNKSSLSNALSIARKLFPDNGEDNRDFTKIDEEEVEKVILSLINRKVDTANVRLMVDFLKIKRQSSGLEEDLDVNKFLKRVKDAQS